MPDFQNFSLTYARNVQNLTGMPSMTVACRVTDSSNGSVIADFTGANTFELLAELKSRSDPEQRYLFEKIANDLIRMKAGLLTVG